VARPSTTCRVRTILERIGDKWAIYVVDRLGEGPRRFTELHRGIDGITGRMLTVTLRGLERDGVVTRTVHAAVPPRVDYELTPLGLTLHDTIGQLVGWAIQHSAEVESARADYDARSCPPPCSADDPSLRPHSTPVSAGWQPEVGAGPLEAAAASFPARHGPIDRMPEFGAVIGKPNVRRPWAACTAP